MSGVGERVWEPHECARDPEVVFWTIPVLNSGSGPKGEARWETGVCLRASFSHVRKSKILESELGLPVVFSRLSDLYGPIDDPCGHSTPHTRVAVTVDPTQPTVLTLLDPVLAPKLQAKFQ